MLDATAARETARDLLKSALDAGAFLTPPPSRFQKFSLKFFSTVPKEGSSWAEHDYQYDDARAKGLIAKAEGGDKVAAAVLREVIIAHSQTFPSNLKAYIVGVLDRSLVSTVRGQPSKVERDVCIYRTVQAVSRLGFKPTRNEATDGRESASSIVSAVLEEFSITIPETTVAGIWQKIHRKIPVNSVRT